MSVETRRLVFSHQELVQAVRDFCRREWIAVPDAEIERIELLPGGEPALVLRFEAGSPMETDHLSLSTRQLVSALSDYCRRHGIPLTRHSRTEIHCADGEVAMDYRIEHCTRHLAAAAIPA